LENNGKQFYFVATGRHFSFPQKKSGKKEKGVRRGGLVLSKLIAYSLKFLVARS